MTVLNQRVLQGVRHSLDSPIPVQMDLCVAPQRQHHSNRTAFAGRTENDVYSQTAHVQSNPTRLPCFPHQSLLVKSIPSRMFSSVSCLPLVYTTTMYRTRSDHALSSRTAWTGGK